MPDKITKFKELLTILNDSVNKEEFLKAFQSVLDYVKKVEKILIDKLDEKTSQALSELSATNETYRQTIEEIKADNQSTLSNLKRWALARVGELFIKNQINERVEAKLWEIDEKLLELNSFKLPTTDDIAEKAQKLALDALSPKIPTNEQITNILSELERLKARPLGGRVGGGFSKIAMDGHIVDDETPLGTVNGVTTDFTLASIPNPPTSLKVYVNGQRMRITEDYTLSNNTITFLVAPPTGSIILCDYRV